MRDGKIAEDERRQFAEMVEHKRRKIPENERRNIPEMMEHKRRKHRGNGGNDRREFPEIMEHRDGRITEMVQIKDGISR